MYALIRLVRSALDFRGIVTGLILVVLRTTHIACNVCSRLFILKYATSRRRVFISTRVIAQESSHNSVRADLAGLESLHNAR